MSKLGKIDGWLLGALLGAIVVFPTIGTTVVGWANDLIPVGWDWFGAYTSKIIVIALFSLIGAITDWTK
jgi:hypothetical protein